MILCYFIWISFIMSGKVYTKVYKHKSIVNKNPSKCLGFVVYSVQAII